MPPTLFLIFNHTLTPDQERDARKTLGVSRIVQPPETVAALWAQIPPELPALDRYLDPVKQWMGKAAVPGDVVLVQGDFGACYRVVRMALQLGMVPVYSTTRREAVESQQTDGSIRLTHHFRHVRFRRYDGEPSEPEFPLEHTGNIDER